jgi:hypothetical protein
MAILKKCTREDWLALRNAFHSGVVDAAGEKPSGQLLGLIVMSYLLGEV